MDMASLEKRNTALQSNFPGNAINYGGGVAEIAITVRGSDWYWTVTAIMGASTIAFLVLGSMKPRQDRIFHYITAAITMVATIAYYSMASNVGWAPIQVEFVRGGNVAGMSREIFFVRYIDWVITTPLLLLDLLLTAGLPWMTIVFVILVDEVMIVTGLCGALLYSTYKWGYYAFGCAALFYIGYALIFEARASANAINREVGRTFLMCGTWTFFLWCLYPIAWGVSEGGNVIAPDSEAVFYGILDICAKPIFGALLIFGHRNIDPAVLGLRIKAYTSGVAVTGLGDSHHKTTNGTGTVAVPAGAVTGDENKEVSAV